MVPDPDTDPPLAHSTARPKSAKRNTGSGAMSLRSTFAGLMSRCTTQSLWRCATARNNCSMHARISLSPKVPRSPSKPAKSPPPQYSKAMHIPSGRSKTATSLQTHSCCKRSAREASVAASAAPLSACAATFTAHATPEARTTPRRTMPNVPRPRQLVSSRLTSTPTLFARHTHSLQKKRQVWSAQRRLTYAGPLQIPQAARAICRSCAARPSARRTALSSSQSKQGGEPCSCKRMALSTILARSLKGTAQPSFLHSCSWTNTAAAMEVHERPDQKNASVKTSSYSQGSAAQTSCIFSWPSSMPNSPRSSGT